MSHKANQQPIDRARRDVVVADADVEIPVNPDKSNRNVPFLVPPAFGELVGRDPLVHRLKELLLSDTNQPVAVLIQLPGVGKTELAIHVANDEEVLHYLTGGVLWAGLGRQGDPLAALAEWALALDIPFEQINRLEAIDDYVKAVKNKIGENRVLLIIDDAWQLDQVQPLLESAGPNCAALVTTRLRDLAEHLPRAQILEIPELSNEDGSALLGRFAPQAVSAEPDRCRELVRAVGALPLALVLMGKYLWKESKSAQPHRLAAALDKLEQAEHRLNLEHATSSLVNMPGSLRASIQISDDALDEESRRALRTVWVFWEKPNGFSKEAATIGLGADSKALDTLVNAGMLETYQPQSSLPRYSMPRAITEMPRYSMPRAITDYAAIQLTAEARAEMHQRATAYFESLCASIKTKYEHRNSYAHNWINQDHDMLKYRSAWRYHKKLYDELTGSPETSNIDSAKSYFDAFWWWGCYRPFPLCDELLADWRMSQRTPDDRAWIHLVSAFQDAYPTGYDKQGKGNWQEVERMLHEIRRLGLFDGDVQSLGPERLHLRAITNYFLAESRRFRKVDDPKAEAYYLETLEIVKKSDDPSDQWNVPWTLWHLSDLYLERGEEERSLRLADESIALARMATTDAFARDNEIIANAYRVKADVHWTGGDLGRAFENYAMAVYYAYLFQGVPTAPNLYSFDFYREMITRTLDRLNELWQRDQKPEVMQRCGELHDFWAPYWNSITIALESINIASLLSEDRRDELAAHLFPAAPAIEDMVDAENSLYAQLVRHMWELMAVNVEADHSRTVT